MNRFKKQEKIKLLTIEQVTKVFFILIPYIKTSENIINEYKDQRSDALLFKDVVQSLIGQLKPEELVEVASILLDIDKERAKKVTVYELMLSLPKILIDNKIIDLYLLFKMLGIFN